MSLILSADFGTSALKVSILDRELKVLDTQKQEYPYILLPGEKLEMAADVVVDALVSTCARLDEGLRGQVEALCYDTFSPSLVLMDGDGNALHNIVTHMDRRSRAQSDFVCAHFGKEQYHGIAGVLPFTGGVSLTTLLWFMQNEGELVAKVEKIGHLPTFLHKHFTGEWAVDLVNASMMGLYDTVGQSGWSEELLESFSVPRRWVSDIVIPGTPLGTLLPQVAEVLGLRTGIPVTMGTNDVVAAHAGFGNSRSGQVLNTAGSSDMVSILTDQPVLHPGYYVRNAGKPGLWQIYATTSGGFAVEWFREEFCKEMDRDSFYRLYLPQCLKRCLDSPVTFDPYLAEDRQSLERRTGAWHGLTLGATRDQMLAALLYAMQKVLGDVVALAAGKIEIDPVIKVTGGLAVPPILELKKQLFGDYTFEVMDEGTVRGNAAMALEYLDS